jgi:hypothetical protein
MYELVVWPDVQEFMELDGFAEHACLANDDFFVEKYGSSAYFVDAEWLKSTQKKDEEKRLLNLAEKLRKCFPEGKMPGTAYYYRCNNREVFLKLKKFFTQYGDYTDEEIVDATKRFVASYQGNYRYLPLAKYFISKNKTITDEDGKNHITEVSLLATYLENKEEGDINNSGDWLMSSRN